MLSIGKNRKNNRYFPIPLGVIHGDFWKVMTNDRRYNAKGKTHSRGVAAMSDVT